MKPRTIFLAAVVLVLAAFSLSRPFAATETPLAKGAIAYLEGVEGVDRDTLLNLDPLAIDLDHRRLRRMPGKASAMVPHQVDQDAEEPSLKLSLIIIASQALDDPEKSLLHQILRQFRVVGGPKRVTIQPLPISIHQRVPGGSITVLTARQKDRNGTCVHGHLGRTFCDPPYCGRKKKGSE